MGKTVKNAVFILMLLTLGISTAFLSYLHFFAPDDGDVSGEWTASLDMTEQAAATALVWLGDIEAVSVSLEDMETYMQDLTVEVRLTLEQTERSEGTFRCGVLTESYDACNQAAYEALATVFRQLLTERLHMAGYTGNTDEDTLEELVTDTFGMSTVSYLMSCGPTLLPPLEELQAAYDGGGTYETAENILTRRFDTGQSAVKTEVYLRKDSYLVLTGEVNAAIPGSDLDYSPVIYRLIQVSEP